MLGEGWGGGGFIGSLHFSKCFTNSWEILGEVSIGSLDFWKFFTYHFRILHVVSVGSVVLSVFHLLLHKLTYS